MATVVAGMILIVALVKGGTGAALPILVLAAVELTFSFDNAVVNSRVLGTMSRFWQTMFLTVGIAIAVFGVRMLLPLLLVSMTSHHSLSSVLDLALHHADVYAEELKAAYPVIAAFGGVFLLMIGLRFFGEKKDIVWLDAVEAPLSEFDQPWWIAIIGVVSALASIYLFLSPGKPNTLLAGFLGAVTFVMIKLLSIKITGGQAAEGATGKQTIGHGIIQLIYLELLDASFSFDGVIAAFAVTRDVILITAGLGIGALFVRSMTIQLLDQATLVEYRYLEHGAHYAILTLSVLLLLGIRYEIPELATGLLGLTIIFAAFLDSRRANRHRSSG